MLVLLRHFVAITALPFVMAVVIPVSIARRNGIVLMVGPTLPLVVVQAIGVGLLMVGMLLFTSSLRRFATEGKGTLAPWDPPRALVVQGPYRFVRNPMISGVVFTLFGEALVLLSKPHAQWALLFVAVNMIYIPLLEEPQLRARFGADYDVYCRHVPRLFPRPRAWVR